MMEYTDIGTLKYLYLDEIEITNGTDADSFLIEVTARTITADRWTQLAACNRQRTIRGSL
jgi:hypothetical protein